jgi:hypothetical protein
MPHSVACQKPTRTTLHERDWTRADTVSEKCKLCECVTTRFETVDKQPQFRKGSRIQQEPAPRSWKSESRLRTKPPKADRTSRKLPDRATRVNREGILFSDRCNSRRPHRRSWKCEKQPQNQRAEVDGIPRKPPRRAPRAVESTWLANDINPMKGHRRQSFQSLKFSVSENGLMSTTASRP